VAYFTSSAAISSSSNLYWDNTNARLGIGTSTPETLLHVNKSVSGGEGGYLYLDNPAASATGNKAGIKFGTSTGATFSTIPTGEITNVIDNAADGASALTFGTFNGSSSGERMRITSGGQVFINQTSASVASAGTKMQINSDILSTGTTAGFFWENRSGGVTYNSNWYGWYTTGGTIYLYNGSISVASINPANGVYTPLSDINKKKDFEVSTIGLNQVLQLKPTLYRMKDEDETSDKHLGFIAQEVKEFIPQAYIQSKGEKEDFIGLDYQAITTALVKAIQEMNTKIIQLEQIVATK
jgi:hypothetical protein